MKHQQECTVPATTPYVCPFCGECYCRHRYGDRRFVWKCPSGAVIALKKHVVGHDRKSPLFQER